MALAEPPKDWDGAVVATWLERRIAAARADQVAAERAGYARRDDCDMAAAEEMVCTLLRGSATGDRPAFAAALKALLDRDEFVWRGVYDDRRFDRHVRSAIRKLAKMTRANEGFGNTARYQ